MVFLGIDWGKIFSVPFWLNVNPGELSSRFEKIFLVVLLINYGCYFLGLYMQKRLIAGRNFIKAKMWQKIETFCLTMAVSFSFIFFFRYEAIPVLGGRFWILIWIITGAVWLGYLLNYYFKVIPAQLDDLEKRQKYEKYIVKVKKKK